MASESCPFSRSCVAGAACLQILVFAGCGELPAPAPSSTPLEQTEPPSEADVTAQPSHERSFAADDPRSRTKWIGDLPYDVFYDQPLQVAAESTVTVSPASATPSDVPQMASPAEVAAPVGSPGTVDDASSPPSWTELISAEVLNEAVTKLRNSLTAHLNTLATYNRNTEAIANDGAILAALAAVAEVHPDAVSWKDNAAFVRDLGYQIYMKADGTGRQAFDATREPFEQIVSVLNGGPPPDLEVERNVPFADIADRSELMKRVKRSFDFLRAEINTADRFREAPDEIVLEASVLASLGGVVSSPSYDSADEEQYQQFVREFIQANVEVVEATQADDFARYESARNRVQRACDACHAEYAFGDESF